MTAAAASETFDAATGERASSAAAGADATAPAIPERMFVTCSVPACSAHSKLQHQKACPYKHYHVMQVWRHVELERLTGAESAGTGLWSGARLPARPGLVSVD